MEEISVQGVQSTNEGQSTDEEQDTAQLDVSVSNSHETYPDTHTNPPPKYALVFDNVNQKVYSEICSTEY